MLLDTELRNFPTNATPKEVFFPLFPSLALSRYCETPEPDQPLSQEESRMSSIASLLSSSAEGGRSA